MIITTIREKMTLFCRILPNESVSRIFDPPPTSHISVLGSQGLLLDQGHNWGSQDIIYNAVD